MAIDWTIPPNNNSLESKEFFGQEAEWNEFFRSQVEYVADQLRHSTNLKIITLQLATNRHKYALEHPIKELQEMTAKIRQSGDQQSSTDMLATLEKKPSTYGQANKKGTGLYTTFIERARTDPRWGDSTKHLSQMYQHFNPRIPTRHSKKQPTTKSVRIYETCGSTVTVGYAPAWLGSYNSFSLEKNRVHVKHYMDYYNSDSHPNTFSATQMNETMSVTSSLPFTTPKYQNIHIRFTRASELSNRTKGKLRYRLAFIFNTSKFDLDTIFEQLALTRHDLKTKILLLTYLMVKAAPLKSGNKSLGEMLFHGYQLYANSADPHQRNGLHIQGKLRGDWDWQVMLHSFDCFTTDIINPRPAARQQYRLSRSRLPIHFTADGCKPYEDNGRDIFDNLFEFAM